MKRLVTALLIAMCLLVLLAGAAAAYDVPIDKQISISGSCQSGENLRATVVDGSGQPMAGQTVTWTISSSPSAVDTLRTTSTTTDANGVTTNSIDVDTVVKGKRVISATARDASAKIELNCGTGGLPRTDTAPASVTPIVIALLPVILFTAAGLLRRRAGI